MSHESKTKEEESGTSTDSVVILSSRFEAGGIEITDPRLPESIKKNPNSMTIFL